MNISDSTPLPTIDPTSEQTKGNGHIPAKRLEKLMMRFDGQVAGVDEDGKITDRKALQEQISSAGGLKLGHYKNGKIEESTETEAPEQTPTATGSTTSSANPAAEETVQNIADKISSGELSKEDFISRLQERFGEAANGIVDEEGAIDFFALLKLIESNSLNATA